VFTEFICNRSKFSSSFVSLVIEVNSVVLHWRGDIYIYIYIYSVFFFTALYISSYGIHHIYITFYRIIGRAGVLRSDFISPVMNKLRFLLELEDIDAINYENHAFKQVFSFTLSPLSSVAVG